MNKRKIASTVLRLALAVTAGCTTLTSRNPSSVGTNQDAIVGIFGDLHEETGVEEKLLAQFKKNHVTHIIGLGDFILWGGPQALDNILKRITPQTGVTKDNIYLAPGNWEQTLNNPKEINEILKKYGNVITDKYDSAGTVTINNQKLRAGHFPQHMLPSVLLPPTNFIKPIQGQVTLADTLQRNDYPAKDITLELFSHTHVGGIYFDRHANIWSINSGDLEKTRKRQGEPQAFAIWYQKKNVLDFIDVATGRVLLEVNLNNVTAGCAVQACPLRP